MTRTGRRRPGARPRVASGEWQGLRCCGPGAQCPARGEGGRAPSPALPCPPRLTPPPPLARLSGWAHATGRTVHSPCGARSEVPVPLLHFPAQRRRPKHSSKRGVRLGGSESEGAGGRRGRGAPCPGSAGSPWPPRCPSRIVETPAPTLYPPGWVKGAAQRRRGGGHIGDPGLYPTREDVFQRSAGRWPRGARFRATLLSRPPLANKIGP
jgi:hypothetical protein